MSRADASQLRWIDDKTLVIRDIQFRLMYEIDELHRSQSQGRSFVLGKAKPMIGKMLDVIGDMEVRHILDIGIFRGGSAVLYRELFHPTKLVAIEYMPEPVEALQRYIEEEGLGEHLKPYYGTNQADREAMGRILTTQFPDRDIDLIVDDASHMYDETRASFNATFPYLRPGGLFILEDWAWAHWQGDQWQKDGGIWPDKPALSNLVVEILLLCASRPDVVAEVLIGNNSAFIRRGWAHLEVDSPNVLSIYLTRGRVFSPSL